MNEFLYYCIISFVGSIVLIFLYKVVMNKPLRRDVNYYETTEKEEELQMLRKANLSKKKNDKRNRKGGRK